ncbi:CpaD family pilus assembly protein [Brevundimonas sp. Root1279]|uniref:CpaD family pilus assembly protein n=1 Tax=Brevundimonas sp. Root1279 TaxID=1736443 RepID=UPI000A658BDF|nr:CpaD family pilus assembly lipoprotein [Brevundimonas sp. Root1279]
MRALILACSAAALLGACTTTTTDTPPPINPLARYSLQVEPGLDRIALAVHDDGLSATQHAALRALVARYRNGGVGMVRVEAPSGDDPVATRQSWDVRNALMEAGVPGDRVVVASYAAPDGRAPVLAGFDTVQAVVTDCSRERRAMDNRFSNQGSLGLGCAITANMAAQIADPRDIGAPRTMSPADSGRAAVVFDNYRKGQNTAAAQEQLVDGRISRAVE